MIISPTSIVISSSSARNDFKLFFKYVFEWDRPLFQWDKHKVKPLCRTATSRT